MSAFNEAEDMPLGLMMQLGQDLTAMNHFSNLSEGEQMELIDYIKAATTGDDAKRRIDEVLNQLKGADQFF